MVKKKDNRFWWVIGIIAVLYLMNQQGEHFVGALEQIETGIKETFNNDWVGAADEETLSFFVLTNFPVTLTAKGQTDLIEMNNALRSELQVNYFIPSSIQNCDQLKTQANLFIQAIKNRARFEIIGLPQSVITEMPTEDKSTINNLYNQLESQLYIAENTVSGKKILALNLPTNWQERNYCNQLINYFESKTEEPSTNYHVACIDYLNGQILSATNYNDCVANGGRYFTISEASYIYMLEMYCNEEIFDDQLSKIYAVCDGDFVLMTTDIDRKDNFVGYANTGDKSFVYYNPWIVSNLKGQELYSTITLNACVVNTDCSSGQICQNGQCISQPTPQPTTPKDNTMLYIIFGVVGLFMLALLMGGRS